jgi:lambda family phage tail tape measure protein
MSGDLKTQLTVGADVSGATAGIANVRKSLDTLGAAANKAGSEASAGIGPIGDKATEGAAKLNAATRSASRELERQIALLKAGERGTAAFYRELYSARGADLKALQPYLDQLDELKQKQRAAAAALAGTTAPLDRVGVSAGQTAAAMRQLPAQFNDIAVSLAGGQSPLLVLAQQGSQVVDSFGGIGNAARSILTILTPARLVFGASAAGLAAIAYAAAQGADEVARFNRIQQASGNASGITAEGFNAAARAIATFSRGSIGEAREILAGLLENSRLGVGALTSVGTAAASLQRVTGQSTEQILGYFTNMKNGVAAFAAEANRQYNYLTLEQFRYIQRLESMGFAEAAAKTNAELLNQALKDRQPQLGAIESLLREGKKAWSEWWNAALREGQPETLNDKLDAAVKRLEMARRRASDPPSIGVYGGLRPSGADVVRQAEGDIGALNRSLLLQAEANAAAAQTYTQAQELIFKASREYQARLSAVQNGGLALRLAQQEAATERERRALGESYERGLISIRGYGEAAYAIERELLQRRAGLIDAQIEAERRLRPSGTTEQIAEQRLDQEARILALRRERVPIEAALAELDEKRRRSELLPAKLIDRYSVPTDALRQFERGQQPQVEAGIAERSQAASAAATELIATNRALSIALIRDERERGLALIGLDEENLRKRLELQTLGADDAKRVADDLAKYRVLREKQLTEQLKPEWQRLLEEWANPLKQSEQVVTNVFRSMEDALVTFATTGKLNIKSLADVVIAEIIRMQVRASLAQAATSGGLLTSVLSLFGFGSPGVGITGANTGGRGLVDLGLGAGRAYGGPVSAYGINPVVERGEPEVLQTRRGTYLLNGSEPGMVRPLSPMPAAGGGGPASITIVNNGTPQRVVSQQQISPREIAIITEDAASQAEARITAGFSDPNSRVSRALSRNVQAPRRRG